MAVSGKEASTAEAHPDCPHILDSTLLGFRSATRLGGGASGIALGASVCALMHYFATIKESPTMAFCFNAQMCCAVGGIYFGTSIAGSNRWAILLDMHVFLVYVFGGTAALFHSPYWLVFLWVAHGLYDILHDYQLVSAKTQDAMGMAKIHASNCQYPLWCIGVDWTIALYTLLIQVPAWKPLT